VAVVQYTFTHKQYTEYRERNIHNKKKLGKCGTCPVFASYTLAFALQLRKKQGKTSGKKHGETSRKNARKMLNDRDIQKHRQHALLKPSAETETVINR
jgi:hypothetical protein